MEPTEQPMEPVEQMPAEAPEQAGQEEQVPEKPTAKERLRQLWRGWILPFGTEILVLLFIIKFLFFFVIVPTGSMIPTIDSHSVLFATRVQDRKSVV